MGWVIKVALTRCVIWGKLSKFSELQFCDPQQWEMGALECPVLIGSWDYLKAAKMAFTNIFGHSRLLGYYCDKCPFAVRERSHFARKKPKYSSLETSFSLIWGELGFQDSPYLAQAVLELRTRWLDKEKGSWI